MGAHAAPSLVLTLPGASDVVSGPSEMCTLPSTSDVGSVPPTPPGECWVARWRGGWSCCRSIPQTAPEYLSFFFFTFSEKFLLLNPATPYKEGPVLSHSPPLQLDRGLSVSGPNTAQLSTLPSWEHMVSVGLPLHSYSRAPRDLKQPGLSQCCSNLVWKGRGPLTWFSPSSPAAGPAGAWPGATVTLVPLLVPRTLLF